MGKYLRQGQLPGSSPETVESHKLTHLSQLNFPVSMGRTSPFQILGVLGDIFHFY